MKKLLKLLLCLPFCSVAAEGNLTVLTNQPGKQLELLLKRQFNRQVDQRTEAYNAIKSRADCERWQRERREYFIRQIGGFPERTPLKAKTVRHLKGKGYRVENVMFESRPGHHVTANLYLPDTKGPYPGVLVPCGHSHTGKASGWYQGMSILLARHGMAALCYDPIGQGERYQSLDFEKDHETFASVSYRLETPHPRVRFLCTVEHTLMGVGCILLGTNTAQYRIWDGMRAIDYLQSRPEVDPERIGVTGRSGGGAYSWWIAALDERVKAAVPVAGITSMRNHIVDGCVESHCDCMYQVNSKRWDFAMISSLVAPRALLISNTDKDGIFPLEGVLDVHAKTRKLYRLLGAAGNLGLQIAEGPHKDTQDLRVHAFSWFNRFLKKQNPPPLIDKPATKYFEPEQLKVFKKNPADEKTSSIHETFVPIASAPPIPKDRDAWKKYRDKVRKELDENVFAAWPKKSPEAKGEILADLSSGGVRFSVHRFVSQEPWELPLYLVHRDGLVRENLDLVVLNVLDAVGWNDFAASYGKPFGKGFPQGLQLPAHDAKAFDSERKMFKNHKWAMAYVVPRGIGPTAWSGDARKRNQILRRFYLLGETLDSMRAYDVVRCAGNLRSVEGMSKIPLWMQANGQMAANLLYASLHIPAVTRLDLHDLPRSHREGPAYLNVLRVLDLPQAVALAGERTRVVLYQPDGKYDDFPLRVAGALEFGPKAVTVRKSMSGE
mgnify:CR=1 FL=1